MATTRKKLDTQGLALIDLWSHHFTDIQDASDIFSDSTAYDTNDSIYTDERETYNSRDEMVLESSNPTVRKHNGLTHTRVAEMNRIVRLNQSGEGRSVNNKKTLQLFNSSKPYKRNEHQPSNPWKSVYDPISKESETVRGKIRYMIDHWERIAKVSVEQAAPIGTTHAQLQNSYSNDNDLNLSTLPGSDHSAYSAAGQTGPNRYRFGGGYRRSFLQNTDNPAERASNQELSVLARNKFNEGQVLGSESWGKSFDRNAGGISLDDLSNTNAFLGSVLDSMFGDPADELRQARNDLENIRQDIVGAYLPGFNRITQPFHAKSSLNEYLQQNVLLPPNTPRDSRPSTGLNSIAAGGWPSRVTTVIPEQGTSTFATYSNTYINNPVRPPLDSIALITSAGGDPDRFDKGAISGVAIKDIERQGEGGVLNTARASAGQPKEIFTHEGHDQTRMTNDMKARGFTQNIADSVRGGGAGALRPAVENIEDYYQYPADHGQSGQRESNNAGDKQVVHETYGDLQYFPFLFTTENRVAGPKDGPFQQVCYLQATIDNLNESFAPTWQPKHFFGRTEQVQTYTNTTRSIDLSFMVHAPDMRSLQNLWERVSWLAQQTYGQYETRTSDQPRLSNGPLLRMTVGDLYVGLPGYIQSLTYDWNALGQGGKWEMTQGIRIPMACKIQMSYMVIHDDNPDRNYNFYSGMTAGVFGKTGERGRLIQGHKDGNSTKVLNSTYVNLLDENSSVGGNRNILRESDDQFDARARL